MNIILQIIYLLIPAGVANIIPILVKKIKFLDYPVDFNLKLFGKSFLGRNKTFRGLFFGIIGGMIFVIIQFFLYRFEFFKNLSLVNYSEINILFFGFLVGFSVLVGDLIGSFVKRRFSFKPGQSFYVLDQMDSIIGFIIFVVPIYFKSWYILVWLVLVWLVGHLIFKYIGYLCKLNKEKI